MVRYFTPIFDPYKDTRGSLIDPCMRLKTGFYSMFSSELGFVLKLYVSPLPIIWPVFVFNKSCEAILISVKLTKQINKKADRFLSNTKNIHILHPLFCVLYYLYCTVKSLFFKCFYGISAMQVLYIFYLTFPNKYERMYKC